MWARYGTLVAWLLVAAGAHAQVVEADIPPAGGWHSVGRRSEGVIPAANVEPVASSVATPAPAAALPRDTAATPRRPIAKVIEGISTLPNGQGQVWREYDISPYTLRVTSTNRPEQALVDWILRETGYEAWHGETLGILSATKRSLRVYHTPDMQNMVADIVDRFVSSQAETQSFELRVAAVDQPNWRTRAQRLLRPVTAHSPGVQAWLLKKEDAAMIAADLHHRSDYRELSRPQMLLNNGQSAAVSLLRGRPYVRDVVLRGDAWPGFESQPAQVDEGFSLELTPLLSLDGRLIDAVIKCDIDQVEKMVPVALDVPTPAAPRQRTQVEVPQIARCRFHERFRWPTDQVLLVDLGIVPLPAPVDNKSLIAGLPLPLVSSPPRADVLVFVEARGDLLTAQRGAAPAGNVTPR